MRCTVRQLCRLCLLVVSLAPSLTAAAEPVPFEVLGTEYARDIKPILKSFCLDCHSTAKQDGELDLERFAALSDVRNGTRVWQKVAEMLDTNEMPPKDAKPQPTAAQKKQLRGWIERYLNSEAFASAGDPGPVVLRRLSNAEYTYTIRDLTGVESLSPAKEFPADSAAGEGFTSAGNAMVMSPSLLTKYFDAGKEIAEHAVLLPDGFRFSPSQNRSDWTNDTLARIRDFYREFTAETGGTKVNLQGIVFDTNSGGRLAVEKYLAATFLVAESLRDSKSASRSDATSLDAIAKTHGLNAKYLGILWKTLNDKSDKPSLLLDTLRTQWRTAKAEDAASLAAEVGRWQQALWRFTSVGHIGKVGGPKAWQEPVLPLVARHEIKVKPTVSAGQSELTLFLVTSDAGDGSENDFVVWERPRFVALGRPELLLRDIRDVSRELTARRDKLFTNAAKSLGAAAEAASSTEKLELKPLAEKHGVEPDVLAAWLDYLGIGTGSEVKIDSLIKQKTENLSGYEFVKGWVGENALSVVANSSDNHVRIPGNAKPHGVVVHPTPTLAVVVGWRSLVAAAMKVEAKVQHAHPECGNGVAWSLEVRRGNTRQRLATGVSQGAKVIDVGPFANVSVKPGDLVSLVIAPRDGNHSCDLTAIDLTLSANDRQWDLARDVSPNILAGNPHADSFGNANVWHFYSEPTTGQSEVVIPAGSLLAKWQAAPATKKSQLANDVQKLLQSGPPTAKDNPDAVLFRQLSSLGGPLVRSPVASSSPVAPRQESRTSPDSDSKKNDQPTKNANSAPGNPVAERQGDIGLDPILFGKHPNGSAVDAASLCVKAPAVIEVRVPTDLVEGYEFVATGSLHRETGAEGSVQLQVLPAKPEQITGLFPTTATETNANGPWTSNNRGVSHATPIVVHDGSQSRRRMEAALAEFRSLFPIALCYTKIVPVDEVVTLAHFYREDGQLQRLMLDEAQTARLNKLWDELLFVSLDALTQVDALEQLIQYATQDADPKVFEPLRKPFADRAAAFRKTLVDSEPKQLDALIAFASQAYRRPLRDSEANELRGLYRKLRDQELPHDEAFRFTLARVFVSPAFLYRPEKASPGTAATLVSDWELATRLSYFLWSSSPDTELRQIAASGQLRHPDVLTAQARRMLQDARVRRLATEFACQWLHIYDFDTLDEKSEKHFPEFRDLRGDMYEESIRFFTDSFQRDASVLSFFDADHTFVNERLAKFYGAAFSPHRARPGGSLVSALPNSDQPRPSAETNQPLEQAQGGDDVAWQRIDGLKQHGRGGLLGMASTLAKQSGASRTSPILRGNWVSEVLLGEKLPKPPKGVPQLPEDESALEGKTVRQLVELHSIDEKCINCHQRIDPFGFALEGFDTIGRRRDKDLGNRPIDTKTKLPDGTNIDGLTGLRDYLLKTRRDAVLRQFCRKLLGYSLGRGIQLSDEPLLQEMQQQLAKHDYRFSAAVETILRSRQFREIRGQDVEVAETP